MKSKMTPYGSSDQAHNVAKVGKSKSPKSLASRMPSADVAAKVGMNQIVDDAARRVVRLNARF